VAIRHQLSCTAAVAGAPCCCCHTGQLQCKHSTSDLAHIMRGHTIYCNSCCLPRLRKGWSSSLSPEDRWLIACMLLPCATWAKLAVDPFPNPQRQAARRHISAENSICDFLAASTCSCTVTQAAGDRAGQGTQGHWVETSGTMCTTAQQLQAFWQTVSCASCFPGRPYMDIHIYAVPECQDSPCIMR
jgi:hypothetical protein